MQVQARRRRCRSLRLWFRRRPRRRRRRWLHSAWQRRGLCLQRTPRSRRHHHAHGCPPPYSPKSEILTACAAPVLLQLKGQVSYPSQPFPAVSMSSPLTVKPSEPLVVCVCAAELCPIRQGDGCSDVEGAVAAPARTAEEEEPTTVAANAAAQEVTQQVTAEMSFVGALPAPRGRSALALRLPLPLPGGTAGGAGERERRTMLMPVLSPPQSPLPYHRREFFGPLSTLKPRRGEPECVRPDPALSIFSRPLTRPSLS